MTREEFLDRIDEIMCGTSNAERAYLEDLYNEVTKPHLISVEDELPKERGNYLVATPHMVCQSEYYPGMNNPWKTPFFPLGEISDVTHWMPLPSVEHFADVSKKISGSSVIPNNCKKFDIPGYENVVIHEGNAKGGILKGGEK